MAGGKWLPSEAGTQVELPQPLVMSPVSGGQPGKRWPWGRAGAEQRRSVPVP